MVELIMVELSEACCDAIMLTTLVGGMFGQMAAVWAWILTNI